ncbi:MAG: hypothetical protein JSR14_07430 [Proteobacteria bacterium]|nr:hypothetical protein [Pseudomonadota bacterium]
MLISKTIAVITLVSWLGVTGERLYDYFSNAATAAPSAKAEQPKSEPWSFSQLRW